MRGRDGLPRTFSAAHSPTDPGVALVTGAARGLGAGIARALAVAGHPVALDDLDDVAAQRVAADIRSRGGRAEVYRADATDAAAVAGLPDAIEANLGPVEVLVVNATGPQPAVGLFEQKWDDLLDQLHYFVKSPWLLVRAFVPRMPAGGRVIMIGSDLADRTEPGASAYSAAKAAQHSLVRSWARELGPTGITVNAVAPGWIPVERHAQTPRADLDAYLERVPLGRAGQPADVGAVVVFLASAGAGFMTGEIVAVNGGHRLT